MNTISSTRMDFKKKLREFVASMYVYDILANAMRDINERVANATKEGSWTPVGRNWERLLIHCVDRFLVEEPRRTRHGRRRGGGRAVEVDGAHDERRLPRQRAPQPSCPPGYGSLFFNKDPSDPTAKIVDPYIVAADGSLVENPNAKYGPYCQRNKNGSDILSGVTNAMSSAGASNLPNFHVANAYRKKRRSHTAKSKRKSRTTRTCGRNAFVGLL
eukprot:jgi/Mesvir1/9995/Mv05786-RA.1